MNIHIDSKTGEIVTKGYVFGPRSTEPEFLASEIGRAAKKIRSKGARNYYTIRLPASAAREFGAALGFLPGHELERVNIKFVKAETRDSPWSKAVEAEIKTFHDDWLMTELGKGPYKFSWGRVLSTIEPHWSSAMIVIDYLTKS